VKNVLLTLMLLTAVLSAQDKGQPHAAKTRKPETPHLEFVKEYIRELTSDEDLLASAEKQLSQVTTPAEQFSTGIYISKSIQLELNFQIGELKTMRLDSPYETMIPSLIGFYQHEIELHQKVIEVSSKFLEGPKPEVDFGALAAKLPQLRAELEATQKAVFEATPLVFMTLIDMKPDSQGHASHLVITKEEKSDLQNDLDTLLKDQSEKGDHDFYISSAMVLRDGFLKGHKCADEPWD
jgi:hypothetical protein